MPDGYWIARSSRAMTTVSKHLLIGVTYVNDAGISAKWTSISPA